MDDSQALALALRSDPSAYQLASTITSTAPDNNATQQAAGRSGSAIPTSSNTKNIPAFLNKLYSMVNDPATDKLIRWTESGRSFIVPSSEKFGKELLPRFFKHSNFGSFVRQLNMYGFHKVPHLQQGVLKLDGQDEKEKAEVLEFRSDNFQKNQPDLLYLIQRKKGNAAMGGGEDADGNAVAGLSGTSGNVSNSNFTKLQGDLAHILNEVQAVKRHQNILSSELRDLQNSNRQLWQENMEEHVKADKNAEMIDKILKFLAGVFGGRALSEGAGFSTSGNNIAMADSMSGLGLGTYGQKKANAPEDSSSTQGRNGRPQPTRTSSGMEMVRAIPRKRQRLLLEGSPEKRANNGASGSGTSNEQSAESPPLLQSQFEELHSDEDIAVINQAGGNGRASTTGTDSRSASPPVANGTPQFQSLDYGTNQVYNLNSQSQPSSNVYPNQPTSQPNNDIDWSSVSSLFNNANNNSSQNASDFSFNNPNFLAQFGLNANSLNSTGTAANTQSNNPASYSLALSPSNPNSVLSQSAPTTAANNEQALTKYNATLNNVSDENTKLKERMDSLSSAIDKLVSQLPEGFTFDQSATGRQNGLDDDDFDFNQYLDNANVDYSSFNSQQPQILSQQMQPNPGPFAQDLQDPLAQYLDPSLSALDAPTSSYNIQAPLYTPAQSSFPEGAAALPPQAPPPEAVNIADYVKAEPSPSPLPDEHPSVGGKAPKRRGKQPAKTAGGRGRKRVSDVTVEDLQDNEDAEDGSVTGQRRSARSCSRR